MDTSTETGQKIFRVIVIIALAYRNKHERDMNRRYQSDNRIYEV